MKIACNDCGELFENLPGWQQHNRDVHRNRADFDLHIEEGDYMPTVEPTPPLADECRKLLDNGWSILLYRSKLGSYTAMATKTPLSDVIHKFEEQTGLKTSVLTDDFGPAEALYRLTEKVFGNIA